MLNNLESFEQYSRLNESRKKPPVPLQVGGAKELYSTLENAVNNGNLPQAKRKGTGIYYHPVTHTIQAALNFLGYELPIYGVDGKFGPETAKAFVDFQEDVGIDSDGYDDVKKAKVTPESIESMIEELKSKKLTDRSVDKYSDGKDYAPSKVTGSISAKGFSGSKRRNVEIVKDALMKNGITNPITIKAILSVIDKESGFNPSASEHGYGKTSNKRIRRIFGKRVSNLSDSELSKLKKDNKAFWDRVYGVDDPTGAGERYGNTTKGDAYRYRGRGFNQLTFKGNYEKYDKLLRDMGIHSDIVNNPEKMSEPKVAAAVVALFFSRALRSKSARRKYNIKDPNEFVNFDRALKAAVNANAGWGRNIERSETYKKALASSRKFDIEGENKFA